MPYYRPRVAAELDVPVLGTRAQRIQQEKSSEVIRIPLAVRSVKVESNDFNHADSSNVTLDWTDSGLDPRMLDDGVLRVYIGDADPFGNWTPGPSNLRFIGHVRNVERELTLDDPATLTIEALDYTSLFLNAKPFGSSGIPEYNLNLEQAWRKICSQVPGSEILADRLLLVGIDSPPLLSSAVAPRFAKLAKVPTNPNTDAWAVWLQCVGMLGLISFIDRDTCVVTTATNYYTEKNPPRLIWGKNLASLKESRIAQAAANGIALTSFDPLTGKTIEAFWPPIGDERVQKKHLKAAKKNAKADPLNNEKREIFAFYGVTDPDALLRIAERVWEERSRQELGGSAKTSEMRIDRVDQQQFDTMLLKAGDSIRVEFGEETRQFLANLPEPLRIDYLTSKGYAPEIAKLLAKNSETLGKLENTFYVTRVETSLELSNDTVTFDVEIDFVNRIQVDKGAVA